MGALVISIAVLSIVVFSLLYLAPGDPALVLAGWKKPNPEVLEAIREQYHLNEPFIVQYGYWLNDVLHLNFGNSIRTGEPVIQTIAPHFGVTLDLVAFSLILSIIIGIVCSVYTSIEINLKKCVTPFQNGR